MRTLATFRSSVFNTTVSKDYFISPNCFGDDVAKWLMSELREKGIEVDKEVGQEDFGWYFNFVIPQGKYCFVVGYRPGDEKEDGIWIGWLERACGFVGSLFGGRKRGISANAVATIHQILAGSSKIRDIHWHVQADFDKGREELGDPAP